MSPKHLFNGKIPEKRPFYNAHKWAFYLAAKCIKQHKIVLPVPKTSIEAAKKYGPLFCLSGAETKLCSLVFLDFSYKPVFISKIAKISGSVD